MKQALLTLVLAAAASMAAYADTVTGVPGVLATTRFKLTDQGQCTMTTGACAAQSLGSTYAVAPACFAISTGGGTLSGFLKVPSTTTTATPTSSVGTDTAVVNWA
ncbi:MAG TPA: hypothetical protein VH114_01770, partial [Candidatus Acidoferrum sp.]|nr:hypothetical protein [Candidatus Acidoferrum sp.]